MKNRSPIITKSRLISLAKLLVSAGLLWAVWRWFLKIDDPAALGYALTHAGFTVHLIALTAAAGNWFIESVKWRVLIRSLQKISLPASIKATLSGAAVSNVIPFRVGEYVGKAYYLKPENRIPAAFNSLFGSLCQMLITVLAGLPAAWMLLSEKAPRVLHTALFTLGGILLTGLLLLLLLPRIRARQGWLKRLSEDVKNFTPGQILVTLLLSALRYLVFGSCYAWMLVHFGIADARGAITGVATIYLLQSLTPGSILTDAGVRTALPLLVFPLSAALQPTLLAVAILNYIYNLLLPSVTGLIFILLRKTE